jgi:hypothetical protein
MPRAIPSWASDTLPVVGRYHDPTTAQFLTRDPLVALTQSAYGYTNENPLNGTDPTGLWNEGACAPWQSEPESGSTLDNEGGCGNYIANNLNLGPVPGIQACLANSAACNGPDELSHLVIGLGGCIGICWSLRARDSSIRALSGWWG